jgi:hypothetical protein
MYLFMCGLSITHKAIYSKINNITSVYYIEPYKTYYKTKMSEISTMPKVDDRDPHV